MLEITIKGKRINFIGDPHLGKNYGGVPLHRRGEREKSQFKQFSDELNSDHDITIMVGDLFDTFNVSNDVLLETLSTILEASSANPDKKYIFISGNHDISRDANIRGSFEVLNYYCDTLPNVSVWMEPGVRRVNELGILLCPYSEFKTAKEVVDRFAKDIEGYFPWYDLVVGHWDTLEIGGTHNLIPLEELSKITKTVVSGHIHVPYTIEHNGMTVYGTGSMQPYSHAEDPEGNVYVTRTVEQVLTALSENSDAFSDKCLRIVIEKGEDIPANINCLQLAVKVISETEKEDLQVELGNFDFQAMWNETFKENDVSEEMTKAYYQEYKELSTDA